MKGVKSIEFKDGLLYLIDQRKLPLKKEYYICKNYTEVEFAIRDMVVRGAPAIGAAAAYGVLLAAKEFISCDINDFLKKLNDACEILNNSRPTAINLMWAINRMRKILEESHSMTTDEIYRELESEANRILIEDVEINKKIGSYGNDVISKGATILTHCNTGALATGGYGTALGVIREAHYNNKDIFVYADETRPRLQGGRLTAWELKEEKIPSKLIADSVAPTLIRDNKIDIIIVGADRIALNGDTANKIGTFMLSVMAKVYNVPFYVAAPISTIDFEIETGSEIEIEERSSEEVTHIGGIRVAPEEVDVYNPAFDVTPWENITGIITEVGIISPPYREKILKLL